MFLALLLYFHLIADIFETNIYSLRSFCYHSFHAHSVERWYEPFHQVLIWSSDTVHICWYCRWVNKKVEVVSEYFIQSYNLNSVWIDTIMCFWAFCCEGRHWPWWRSAICIQERWYILAVIFHIKEEGRKKIEIVPESLLKFGRLQPRCWPLCHWVPQKQPKL